MKFLRSAFALAAMAFASSAHAEWQGCYAGAGVGYSMTGTSASLDQQGFGSFGGIDGLSTQGVTGSILAGCDVRWQNIVVGAFGDYTFGGDNDARITGYLGDAANHYLGTNKLIGFGDEWTVGGRLGYVVQPGILAYGLVGYTHADVDGLVNYVTSDFSGVTFGGGAEFALGGGFYGQLEYRYTDFDSASLNLGDGASVNVDPDEQRIRAAILYRFDL